MRALFRVEVRRLLARRLFRALTILVIAGFALAGILTYINSNDSPEAVAAADAQRRAEVRQCVERFSSGKESSGETAATQRDQRAACEREVWVPDPRFVYVEVEWILMSMGIPLIMLAWLIGASFIGAEYTNRTLISLLTWEPRRRRVVAAKAGALSLVGFVWVALLQTFLASALYPAAALKGTTAGVDAAFWATLAGVGARVAAAAVVAALLGFSLALAGKSTAAALGVGFAHLAVVEGLVRAFRPAWTDWLIGDNLSLFLMGADDVAHLGHSQPAAGLLLVGYGAAAILAATAWFMRREMA